QLRGAAEMARGDEAGARKDFEKAKTIDPKFRPALIALANLDRKQKHPAEAEAGFRAVLALDSGSLDAHIGLASLAADAGKTNDALDWLKRGSAANPSNPLPNLLMVRYLLETHDNNRALSEATALSNRFQNNPSALDALGTAQLASGKPEDAIRTYERLV